MSRIDHSSNPATHLGAGRGPEAASATGLVRIDRLGAAGPRTRIEARRKARQLKALSSATEIAEQDMADLRDRPRDEVIARLSRLLVAVEERQGAGDEIDGIFSSIVNEHVRRLLLVKKPQAGGQAEW